MAIVKVGGGLAKKSAGGLVPAKAAKHPAKGAKHAGAKKHAAKKHPAKKGADQKHAAKKSAAKQAKHARGADPEATQKLNAGKDDFANEDLELALAFHSLNRAGAVISLLDGESGGDLKKLLEHGIELYRKACKGLADQQTVACAAGILKAAEHLGMAGLYAARKEHRAEVKAPVRSVVERHLQELGPRLDKLSPAKKPHAERLESMARELLRRAEGAGDDPHLEFELVMAADGICSALEAGL